MKSDKVKVVKKSGVDYVGAADKKNINSEGVIARINEVDEL